MIKKILLALAAVFILFTFYFLWKQAQPQPEVYQLAQPHVGAIEQTVTAMGRIEPRTEVGVKPKVTGIVKSIDVKLGDRVRKNQLLATIQVIPDQHQITSAQSEVNIAEVELQNAQREYSRAQSLFSKKVISRRELEAGETALQAAREKLQGCRRMLEVARRGFDSQSADVTQIRSTIDGTVMELPVKVGTSVVATNDYSEGTTIVVVGQMDDMVFRGSIDETDAASLRNGQAMHLQIGSMKNQPLRGALESVSPRGKSQNGTIQFDLVATVETPDSLELRAGYSCNADFVVRHRDRALIIDEGCVEYEGGKAYVRCLVSDPADTGHQVFERREVVLGISNGIEVEVVSGLQEGTYLRGLKQ